MFQVMSFFATAEHERERLKYFVSPEGRDDLYQYNQKERRTVLEVRSMNSLVSKVHECKGINETIIDKVWWFLSLYSIMMHK